MKMYVKRLSQENYFLFPYQTNRPKQCFPDFSRVENDGTFSIRFQTACNA